jgi:hypothetical protein
MDTRKKSIYPMRIKTKCVKIKKVKSVNVTFPFPARFCCRFVCARVAHIPTSFQTPNHLRTSHRTQFPDLDHFRASIFLPFFLLWAKGGGIGYQAWRFGFKIILGLEFQAITISPNSRYLFFGPSPLPLPFPLPPPPPGLPLKSKGKMKENR